MIKVFPRLWWRSTNTSFGGLLKAAGQTWRHRSYGRWSGRENFVSYQDVIIATKRIFLVDDLKPRDYREGNTAFVEVISVETRPAAVSAGRTDNEIRDGVAEKALKLHERHLAHPLRRVWQAFLRPAQRLPRRLGRTRPGKRLQGRCHQ